MHLDVALLLMWLAAGALICPLIAPRLGVPEAVLQIGYGMVVGALGLVGTGGEAGEVLAVLSELGFILLMFGAGLEIDFDAVERGGRSGILRGLGVAVGGLVVSAALALTLGLGPFYIVVLSATSIGLAVVVLRETGTASTNMGQAILLIGSIGEFLTLIAMTVFDVHHHVGMSPMLLLELAELFGLMAVGVVFMRFLKAWTWWHPGLFRRVFTEHDPSELGVRAAVAACLVFVVIAVALQVESVLGAFLAGAVSRIVFRDVSVLESKMSALSSGFFIPIFFISVGVVFDLAQLSWQGLASALGLGLLVMAGRVLPALSLTRGVGLGLREALGVALLLGTPLTLLVAIARLGLDLGVIDGQQSSAIVLLAILLAVGLPIAFRALSRTTRSA